MKKIINPWKGLDGYMCFGCAPENPQGLHMEFYEDGEDIVAFWEPESHYQGWLETLHGGIQTTMMDELAGWVVLRKLQTSGVTSRLDARFLKSISTREPRLMIRGAYQGAETECHIHRDGDIQFAERTLFAGGHRIFCCHKRTGDGEVSFCRL